MKNDASPHDSRSDAPSGPPPVTLAMIRAARDRLAGVIAPTPCVESRALGDEAGVTLWLKHDHLQPTGSFKERGAAHALATLSARERAGGVVAASAGNHGLGLAHHGARLGVRVTLVVPRGASPMKVARCRALGAEVQLEGNSFEEADGWARTLAEESGRRYVHPFDDPAVIAGQGTMALEILEQAPPFTAIVVPVGGGGLLAGTAVALKSLRPDIAIVAAEPAAAPSYAAAWEANAPVRVPLRATLADGLAVAQVGRRTFTATRGLVDAVVSVSEDEIAYAMLRLFDVERVAVEGAGAVALAALLTGRLAWLVGRCVVVPVCGANVDARTLTRALDGALRAAGTAG